MIDVKDASQKAFEHFTSLFPEQDLGKILLEEAELSEDEKFWLITLSYKSSEPMGVVGSSVFSETRSYKVFKLDAETGEVKSMKIRTIK